MNRRGMALLAVLWLTTALTSLALAAVMAAREAQALADNRIAGLRARWVAEGCVHRQVAALEAQLRAGIGWEFLEVGPAAWDMGPGACAVGLRPAGWAVDINRASSERLRRLFHAMGLSPMASDSLAAAVLDWRDADEVPRPLGAERDWYRTHLHPLPSNRAFADAREVLMVRSGAILADRLELIGVEEDRTPINVAPLAVVGTLPGIGPEAVNAMGARRRLGPPLASLAEIGTLVSGAARDSFHLRFAELVEVATVAPAAWLLTAAATDGSSPVSRSIELRLERGVGRLVVVGRRQW